MEGWIAEIVQIGRRDIKDRRYAGGEKGLSQCAIGISCGNRATKIPVPVNVLGRLLCLSPTPDNIADIKSAAAVAAAFAFAFAFELWTSRILAHVIRHRSSTAQRLTSSPKPRYCRRLYLHSHSIVPGGFDVTS